jgi:hypothetical protein
VAIGGATAQSYVLQSADVGHTLRATVTASNAFGSAGAGSAATAVVQAAGGGGGGGGTLGKTSVGALRATGGLNYLDSSGPYTLAAAAGATSLTGYVAGGSQPTPLRAVIYADDGTGTKPGALVAVSGQVVVAAGAAAAWVTFPLPAQVALAPGRYWLGYWIGGNTGSYLYDDVAGSEQFVAAAYSSVGSPPASYGSSRGSSSSYSLYVTYVAG